VQLSYFDPNCTYEFDGEGIVKEYANWNQIRSDGYGNKIRYLAPENRTYNLKKFQQYALLPDNDNFPVKNGDSYSPLRNLADRNMKSSFLDEVKLGDLVFLRDSKLRVGGFASRKRELGLDLSHVDPNSELQRNALCTGGYSKGWLLYGNEVITFYTSKFEQALLFLRKREILRESEVPKEEPERTAAEDVKVKTIYSDFLKRDGI
jgi:hypothetical protein